MLYILEDVVEFHTFYASATKCTGVISYFSPFILGGGGGLIQCSFLNVRVVLPIFSGLESTTWFRICKISFNLVLYTVVRNSSFLISHSHLQFLVVIDCPTNNGLHEWDFAEQRCRYTRTKTAQQFRKWCQIKCRYTKGWSVGHLYVCNHFCSKLQISSRTTAEGSNDSRKSVSCLSGIFFCTITANKKYLAPSCPTAPSTDNPCQVTTQKPTCGTDGAWEIQIHMSKLVY